MGAENGEKVLEQVLNIIFPNVCGICGKIDKNSLCPKCKIKIKKNENAKIIKIKNKNFTEYGYLFKYNGIIREKILDYKFNDKSYLYKTFTEIIIKNKKICGFIKKYDIIIPVPIHKKRRKERGYNQSKLIAKEIAKRLEINMEKDVLYKIKNNKAQMLLTKKEREINIKNVYKIIEVQKIKNKKILLLDDIYTTGNTVNECSKMIKEAGASKIAVLTIAKD